MEDAAVHPTTDVGPSRSDRPRGRSQLIARSPALSGVVLFGLLVAALFAGASTLTTTDVTGATAIRDWGERHDQLGLRLALLEAAAFVGLVFAAVLKVRIERWGAATEALWAFAGAVLLVGLLAAHGTVVAAVLAADDLSGDPQVAKTLLLLDGAFGVGMGAAFVSIVAGLSIAAHRNRMLPRWVTMLGLATLGVFVINAAVWQTASMSILGLLWLPVASVALALTDGEPPTGT